MAVLADFARRRDITFPLLSDAESATITNYGILNTTEASTSRIVASPSLARSSSIAAGS